MYCVKCGVELADTEKQCPLCGTVVFHPDISRPAAAPLYPAAPPTEHVSPWGLLFILTGLCVLPILLTLLCDLSLNGRVVWSGYVVGALLCAYVIAVLPFWFRRPQPVVFVPVGFVAVGCYLLYIDLAVGGGWFLSFAFPVAGAVGLLVSAVVALVRYVRRGHLFIYGGALLAAGALMLLVEFLADITFGSPRGFSWAFYPLTVLALLGVLLLIVALCRPLRESLRRRFFL